MKTITTDDYREELKGDPGSSAIVPKAVALKWLEITSPTFDRWVKIGKIQQLAIKGVGRFILADSVFDILTEREERKEKTRSALVKCAHNEDTITYSELMNRVGMAAKSPYDRSVMGRMLGEISEKTAYEHGFMLSALAVLKATGVPSSGFFDLAEQLARKFRNKKGEKTPSSEL